MPSFATLSPQSAVPKHHQRTYSWPPNLHLLDIRHLTQSKQQDLEDIDEDPFSHFLTPVTEEDDPFDSFQFSAGIILNETPRASKARKFKASISKKWARYVAKHHRVLHQHYHAPKHHQQNYKTVIRVPSITVTAPHEPTRGRAQEILAEQKGQKRMRASRTLSGRRHAWREPSVDIFTVMEEAETLERNAEAVTGDGTSWRSKPAEVMERARL
ncbi:hypothetical protein M501DRAFT_929703 [Patellaria atrata CBS 101060]|uniref:Uncharacterized protein n=1 Tax=Patellaria atrata CBS 101060 TaxID=1346257 RepID=A0A9P4SE45_9PEZI|nr:hypothetical protein M501DRAFT_929703 [Patellaria atrata CBS 101060]